MTKKKKQEERNESSLIEQVFGAGACLYTTVLGCSSSGPTVSAALIRKAYYRSALKYHPDKQKGNGDDNQRFLAISMAYQILSNEESRRDYDETGMIPSSTNDDDDDDFGAESSSYASNVNKWKQYFGSIFGTVTHDKIDSFKQQYKCSDEEGRDVWREFIRHGGNCHAMLNHVMCSELVDVPRWITDYIQPALTQNDVAESVRATLTKTAAECQRKLDQQQRRAAGAGKKTGSKQASPPRRSRGATAAQAKRSKTDETDEEDEEEADHDETTTTEEENEEHEESDQEVQPVRKAKTKKVAAKKSGDLDAALVAQIRGKSNNSDALWANIEARYAHDKKRKLPDPLTDEQFDQVQARLLSNKTNKFKGTNKKK
jgi:DnaJ homolog subfamily C member 9